MITILPARYRNISASNLFQYQRQQDNQQLCVNMESLQEKLDSTFFKPQGNVSRYLSSAFIFMVGAVSIYMFFAVQYFLCADNQCDDLVITKPWVNMPGLFIVYGLCSFIVSIFVFSEKELKTVFAWSFDLLVGSGFYLFGKSFFAIAIEIGKNT
ncbi:MAG: hypothetical protein KUF72_06440 [Candidatus Thiodiazotropha sp. (ex Ctena orbiculata)]|nr:hypothetical protein [Candidatus Thiodiazotropha taylori]